MRTGNEYSFLIFFSFSSLLSAQRKCRKSHRSTFSRIWFTREDEKGGEPQLAQNKWNTIYPNEVSLSFFRLFLLPKHVLARPTLTFVLLTLWAVAKRYFTSQNSRPNTEHPKCVQLKTFVFHGLTISGSRNSSRNRNRFTLTWNEWKVVHWNSEGQKAKERTREKKICALNEVAHNFGFHRHCLVFNLYFYWTWLETIKSEKHTWRERVP